MLVDAIAPDAVKAHSHAHPPRGSQKRQRISEIPRLGIRCEGKCADACDQNTEDVEPACPAMYLEVPLPESRPQLKRTHEESERSTDYVKRQHTPVWPVAAKTLLRLVDQIMQRIADVEPKRQENYRR
jgi:hypothetical protein